MRLTVFQFRPKSLEVTRGATVTFLNQDEILHTVTAGTPGSLSGEFDGRLDGKDSRFEFGFNTAGTYPYFCNVHQAMRGEITVK